MIAAITLAGCRAEIEISGSVADLSRAMSDEAGLDANAVIGIETVRCAQTGPQIAKAMEAGFGYASFIGCRRSNLDTLADIRVRLPITNDPKNMPAAIALVVATHTAMPDRVLALMINRDKMRSIQDALPEDLRPLADGDLDPEVTMTLRNDSETVFVVKTSGAWIDGIPRQLPFVFDLKPRAEVRIRASDVGNYSLFDGATVLMELPK